MSMGKCALLAAAMLLVCGAAFSQEKPKETPPAEQAANPRLVKVKRICVQKFGEDVLGAQAQEMIIAKLFESHRFTLTENCEKADYVLKGSITERTERTYRSESEGIGFGRSAAASESSGSGVTRSGTAAAASVRGDTHESLSSSEVKEQAAVTMRLVDKDGEILWAASLESTGGKTKGAIGDAAERAVRKFLRDLERAEKQNASPPKP
ncbi:MAG: hypothetical protein HY234_09850 [Acidobacteria bacterium]|nr:hypothetical protein [Acidobacteriota bacterium]MBI3663339.1 hypothetical protein [Acidobacteriota bacterium]